MHYITVRVEGFDPQKLLSLCLKEGVALWNIRIYGNLEMTLREIEAKDLKKFMRIKGNRYRSPYYLKTCKTTFYIVLLAIRLLLLG